MSRQSATAFAWVLTSGLLAACATQTYEAKPIQPDQSAARFQQRSLTSPDLRAYMLSEGYPENAFPIKAWGLPELTLSTFYYHPQLAVARAQWQAMQSAEITAGQKPNPGLSTSLDHHSKAAGVSPWTLGFAIDIPIETSGKRAARMDRAASLSEAARIEIGQVAWQLRSQLRSRWVDYLAALQQIDLLKRETALRGEIVQMLQNRLDAGMVSDIDLGNARLSAQKSQQTLAAEEGKLPVLKAALAESAGLPAEALDASPLISTLPTLSTPTSTELQSTALLNRLDIRAALVKYQAAEARLRLEIAKQHPDITLSPGYSFDQGDIRWSLGLSTILALLNKNEGPIAEANAQRELEARQFDALQMGVIGALEQAKAHYQSALDEFAKAQRLLTKQNERTARSERQFEAGQIDRLELTSARLEDLGAEQGLQAAHMRAQRALGMLEDAIQHPLNSSAPPTIPEHPVEIRHEP